MHERRFQWRQKVLPTALCATLFSAITCSANGQPSPPTTNRYAVLLAEPPVAAIFSSREALRGVAAGALRHRINTAQLAVRRQLAAKNIRITGSVATLMDAIFIVAEPASVEDIKGISGVAGVVPLRKRKILLNRALPIVNAPLAWSLSGGASHAGEGIKIGILDTGIDQNHPSLRDDTLKLPAGYPKCDVAWCSFTNSKVIVARSYVQQLGAGSNANDPAAESRPDDNSPRDHDGHGTAVATSAAGTSSAGVVTISGVAPRAYLGNYRIVGSPQVNDGTYDDALIQALDDAINDGMDIVSVAVGGPSLSGPLDTGAACGNDPGVPCDAAAQAVETAVQAGLTVVVPAGNDGSEGQSYPNYNSIDSPADAPSVIAVGASSDSHYFSPAVRVTGDNVPAELGLITAFPGDSSQPAASITAPLADVKQLEGDGLACSPLPTGSLDGKFGLVEQGPCGFTAQMNNLVGAGAIGGVFYAQPGVIPTIFGLSGINQPAYLVASPDGENLRNFIDSHVDYPVTIDPSAIERPFGQAHLLASFSSSGPASGTNALKPDLLAPGKSIYVGTQSYDRLGSLYSSTGFIVANGTSIAAGIVAGAAALVKQAHQAYTPAQIKSALVNTASQLVVTDDGGNPVNILRTGAGELAVDLAILTGITANPASLSFGSLSAASPPAGQDLLLTNGSLKAADLTLTSSPALAGVSVSFDKSNFVLGPGASETVRVSIPGALPAPGLYSGTIVISGDSVSLRVPYMFLVTSGHPTNVTVLGGNSDVGTVGQVIPDVAVSFKVTDEYGLPVVGLPVTFEPHNGVTLSTLSTVTNAYGIAFAIATLGPNPGPYEVDATADRLKVTFTGLAVSPPVIKDGGIVDAAAYSSRIAPGSYAVIFGANLWSSQLANPPGVLSFDQATTATLPLAIDYSTVSFDVPSAGISLPGRLVYAGPDQMVVQIPWELEGQSTVQVKSSVASSNGNVVTIPLVSYAPALFTSGDIVAATDAVGNVITSSHPAVQGQTIVLYANGLGPVTNRPSSGSPALADPLSSTTTKPQVTIGGVVAEVVFSGLAPTVPGLYQLNVTVPPGPAAGNLAVTVSIGGQSSPPASLPVQ